MPRKESGFRREQLTKPLHAVHEVGIAAAFKVGTAYTHAEQGVARKGDGLLLTVKDTAARRVARGRNDAQRVRTETNGVAARQVGANRGLLVLQLEAKHASRLIRELRYKKLVVGTNLGFQPVVLVNSNVAKAMIQMTMRAQQVDRLEPGSLQVAHHGLPLGGVEGSTVNDDCLKAVIADDVHVLLNRVDNEFLDVKLGHRYSIFP